MRIFLKKILIGGLICRVLFGTMGVPVYADKYDAICDDPNLASDVKKDICQDVVRDDRSIVGIVQTLVGVAMAVLGTVAVVVLVIAGQRYITAAGDPGKLKSAKDMLVWGIVGLLIAVLAYAIVALVAGAV